MEENKKEYLQPVIEIEYYEDVVLCATLSGTKDSPYAGDPFAPLEDPNGTW